MAASKTLKQSELYELVWQQPMARLAQNFAISDVGLAKICRKHDIPRPPRGYWAKKQFGQEPPQIPLPPSQEDTDIEMRDGSEIAIGDRQGHADLHQRIAAEKSKELRIEVAETLRGAHELVSQTNQELQSVRTDEYGIIIRPDKLTLDVATSKAALRRALLIMDALLKALEQRGYDVKSGPCVTIMDAKLRFNITEQVEAKREPADDDNLEGRYEFGFNRFKEKRCPSGRLTLSINEGGAYWLNGCRHSWRDTEKKKLEDRLNQFVAGLVEMAARIRQHDEEVAKQNELRRQEEEKRAEQARLLAEKRKEFKAEKARVDQLVTQAEDWNKSKLIRELVEAVRQAHSATGPIAPDSDIAQWIEWASRQAERFDPLRPSPPSILDENIPEEEPPRQGYYHRW